MRFTQDPLREEFLKHERASNEELVYAEHKNITEKFLQLMRKKTSKTSPENMSIILYGPPRDGKSYVGIALAYIKKSMVYEEHGIDIQVILCRDESEFIECVQNAPLWGIYVIDEKKETMVQEGSFIEEEQMKDIDNICAVKCLTVIRIKPQEILGSNALISLKTHGKNLEHKCTRVLIKVHEMSSIRWIGYITIDLHPILCDDRKQNIVHSCSLCPKFQPYQEGLDYNKQPTTAPYCTHFIAGYERRKLENVDKILEGSAEYRTQILLNIAEELSTLPGFIAIKNKDAKILYTRSVVNNPEVLQTATNRRLTVREIEQVVSFAVSLHKIKKEEGRGV